MRRLLAYVSVTVFLDITFFAALTPLLPQLVSEFGLSKTGAGVLTAANAAGALVGGVPSALVSTDCQRMQWSDGRWWIGAGDQPAYAPSAWPGSADAVRAGWRTLSDA